MCPAQDHFVFLTLLIICITCVLSVIAVCKFKAHKRCAVRASRNCKWTTLASIGKDIIEEDGVGVNGDFLLHTPLYMDAVENGAPFTMRNVNSE